jgi:hypothetical protein
MILVSETAAMAANPPREQEQSIKDRKRLLYDDDDLPASSVERKPFALYLRETPATPLSGPVKAALWAAAVVVGLLLAAAAMKSIQGKPPEPAKPKVKARAKAKARAEVIPIRVSNPRFA